jgi:excisionase family DNA binding protein
MAPQSSAWTGEKPRKAGNGAGRGSAARSGEKVVSISPTGFAQNGHVWQACDRYSILFTKQQAADYVQCTPRYLERQIRAGRLRALRPTGKLVRIRRSDLDAFLESGSTIGDAA